MAKGYAIAVGVRRGSTQAAGGVVGSDMRSGIDWGCMMGERQAVGVCVRRGSTIEMSGGVGAEVSTSVVVQSGWVRGMSQPLDHGVESVVGIRGVVHPPDGAVGVVEAVGTLD